MKLTESFSFFNWFADKDASGKFGSGIYEGNNVWFGSFSECKNIDKSRYCLVFFDALVYLDSKWIEVCDDRRVLHWTLIINMKIS